MQASNRWLAIFLHLGIFAVLQIAYAVYLAPVFEYEGYANNFNVWKVLIASCMVGLAAILLPIDNKPSTLFLHLILAMAVTPAMVFMGGADVPWDFGFVFFVAFLVVAVVGSQNVALPLPRPKATADAVVAAMLGVASLSVLIVAAAGGYRFINFDFSQVYDFRRNAADALPPAFAYVLTTVTKAIIPLALVLAYKRGRILSCSALIACAFLLAAMSNHKAPLFYPFLVLGVLIVSQKSQPIYWFLALLLVVVTLGVVAGLLVVVGQQDWAGWLATLVVRRALMLPALLNFYYWEFFSEAPHIFWADSRLSLGINENPHGVKMAVLIGAEYFGTDVNANTGWIGSGMGQAGYFGIALYSVGLGILLLIANSFGHRLGGAVASAIFFVPVLTGAFHTDFSSIFVFHGAAVLLLLTSLVSPLGLPQGVDGAGRGIYCRNPEADAALDDARNG
jgi:hypothetical protein